MFISPSLRQGLLLLWLLVLYGDVHGSRPDDDPDAELKVYAVSVHDRGRLHQHQDMMSDAADSSLMQGTSAIASLTSWTPKPHGNAKSAKAGGKDRQASVGVPSQGNAVYAAAFDHADSDSDGVTKIQQLRAEFTKLPSGVPLSRVQDLLSRINGSDGRISRDKFLALASQSNKQTQASNVIFNQEPAHPEDVHPERKVDRAGQQLAHLIRVLAHEEDAIHIDKGKLRSILDHLWALQAEQAMAEAQKVSTEQDGSIDIDKFSTAFFNQFSHNDHT